MKIGYEGAYLWYMVYMGVSKNMGKPPKSSIFIGFSIINHPFWGTPIFGNTHIYIYIIIYVCLCIYFPISIWINMVFLTDIFRLLSCHLNKPLVNRASRNLIHLQSCQGAWENKGSNQGSFWELWASGRPKQRNQSLVKQVVRHEKKKLLLSINTGCLTGILIMVYYNP